MINKLENTVGDLREIFADFFEKNPELDRKLDEVLLEKGREISGTNRFILEQGKGE